MSLKRKANHLRKAQARLDRIQHPPRWKVISHLKATETQIEFRRSPNRKGKYKTHAYVVRGEKSYHGNNRGLIHKAVNVKYRIYGDKPSVTKALKSWKPKSKKGKFAKASAVAVNFIAHDAGKTAVDTALAAETIGLKSADIAGRETKNKLKQAYTRNAVDDYHRGVFFLGRTTVDAVRGLHQHRKMKCQHKLEKAKFQVKKADNKLYKAKTGKPKLAANKADLKRAKAEYKAKKKSARGNKFRKAMNKRRLQAYRQDKRELKFERKQLKTEHRFRVKELENQRKIADLSKSGLLIFKPAKYTANRMKASAWQKAVNEDQNNDVLHAMDSAKRRIAEPAVQKISKPQRLQKQEKKRDRLNDSKTKSNNRLNRQESKLKQKHDSYKKKKKPKPKPKSTKKSAKDTISTAVKAVFKFVKNLYASEAKKFFLCASLIVLVILLVLGIFTMIFSATSSHSGFTLGTYAAQDYDLSETEKYYTQLAYNLNEKVRKVGDSSDWKDGLADFGANRSDLRDTPDEWVFGRSTHFNYDPVYDFDTYKLWAFLCAYYYDFDSSNDDIYYWNFGDETKTLLDEIFDAEYEFQYFYDNSSRWEEYDRYEFSGGIDGSYWLVDSSEVYRYSFKPKSNPSALNGFKDNDGYLHLNEYHEILNAQDAYNRTGWYIQDQRYFVNDRSGQSSHPFYAWYNGCEFGRTYGDTYHKRSYWGFSDTDQIYWCVSPQDTLYWRSDLTNSCLISYYHRNYWQTDCRLYYNVKQNHTFDEVIADKLSSMSHSDERMQYYNLLVGNDGATLHGNHQTLHNLLPGATVREYSLKRGFGYEMTGWNETSEGLYQGIKVYCNSGDRLKAPFKCKITNVDTDNNKITLRKDDVEYWYDGTGGTKRDTEVTIANAVLLSGFAEGDTLEDGQEFAYTTAGNVNFHIYIDTDGYGWDYIDPRLVLY